jgi:hypothetical protein
MDEPNLRGRLGLLHEQEVADMRGISLRALRNERYRRQGPAFVRMSNKVFYRIEHLKKFIEASTVKPSSARTLIDGKSRQSAAR